MEAKKKATKKNKDIEAQSKDSSDEDSDQLAKVKLFSTIFVL